MVSQGITWLSAPRCCGSLWEGTPKAAEQEDPKVAWFEDEVRAGRHHGEESGCKWTRLRLDHGLGSWVQAGQWFGLDGLVGGCCGCALPPSSVVSWLCWGLLHGGAGRLEPQVA